MLFRENFASRVLSIKLKNLVFQPLSFVFKLWMMNWKSLLSGFEWKIGSQGISQSRGWLVFSRWWNGSSNWLLNYYGRKWSLTCLGLFFGLICCRKCLGFALCFCSFVCFSCEKRVKSSTKNRLDIFGPALEILMRPMIDSSCLVNISR